MPHSASLEQSKKSRFPATAAVEHSKAVEAIVNKTVKKTIIWVFAAFALVAGLGFASWAIQAAWLSQFPGADADLATQRFAIRSGVAVFCLIAGLVLLVWGWRIGRSDGEHSQ